MRLALVLLLLTSLPALAQPAFGPEPEVPIRIMPVGDSITEGNDGGFRIPLIRMVTRAFEMPDLVGRRVSDDNGVGYDHDQDGYSAYRIDEIASGGGPGSFWDAPPIEQRLDDWDPAVVLLHAGTNDAQQSYYPYGDPALGIPNVIERLDDLVSRIVAHSPHVYVIVAQIIPANPPAGQTTIDYIEAFNRHVPGVVARHQALGHRVSLVDMYTPMLAFPNPDGIHPSQAGFQKMAEVWLGGLRAIGFLDGDIQNPEPGRDDGVRQRDYYSTSSETPWPPSGESLIRAGSATLEDVLHLGYDGSVSPEVLNDGLAGRATNDPDNQWVSTFVLDTSVNTAGYDITQVGSGAGGPRPRNLHQAYEVWYSSVGTPFEFVRLGDFHHIPVNDLEQGSAIVVSGVDGPLASGVRALQFRFKEPPLKQRGFFGQPRKTRYYEVEALGTPTASGQPLPAASTAAPNAFALGAAHPNPFASATRLSVDVPEASHVRLVVYDVLGRAVATLADGELEAGQHAVRFDASGLPSGMYLVRLAADGPSGSFVTTQRVTRLR